MWYIEGYDPTGISAKWWKTVPDFAEVRARLFEACGKDEMFRVRAPRTALPAEIDELCQLGARRF
jgi:hypothetical protein